MGLKGHLLGLGNMENTSSHSPDKRRRPPPRGRRHFTPHRKPRPPEPRPATASVSSTEETTPPSYVVAPRTSHSNLSPLEEATNEVEGIRVKLEGLLEDMEHVLELLGRAEQEKIGTEREIDALRRSLRNLHRPAPRQSSFREAPPRGVEPPMEDADRESREDE